jgi:ATP/maltotriose-dependent transcriptional regulator MalT
MSEDSATHSSFLRMKVSAPSVSKEILGRPRLHARLNRLTEGGGGG